MHETQSSPVASPLRLHIGGWDVRPGWKIMDIQARPGTDYIGHATDLSAFATGSVAEIYASHIYEHLDYTSEVDRALAEACRVLKPGGLIRIGVPDMEVLARLLLDKKLPPVAHYSVMRMMFGGQADAHDYHKVGFTFEILKEFLNRAGFRGVQRVRSFGLFNDSTTLNIEGNLISLNVSAMKPM
jgi:predicted SAM-dependent methyltransferase